MENILLFDDEDFSNSDDPAIDVWIQFFEGKRLFDDYEFHNTEEQSHEKNDKKTERIFKNPLLAIANGNKLYIYTLLYNNICIYGIFRIGYIPIEKIEGVEERLDIIDNKLNTVNEKTWGYKSITSNEVSSILEENKDIPLVLYNILEKDPTKGKDLVNKTVYLLSLLKNSMNSIYEISKQINSIKNIITTNL